MPGWFIWSLIASGLSAAFFYKKSKDPGFTVLKTEDPEPSTRQSSKP